MAIARYGLAVMLLLLCLQPAIAERIIEADPEDYREYLSRLGPGDILRLAPGIYRDGLPLRGTTGEPGRPVVIEGPGEGAPAVFEGRDGRITVSLIDVGHVTIRNLILDGQGARAHGVVAEGRGRFAHHVTLENLEITGFDAAQAFNGISTKTPAWNWIIRNNYIHRVGTGMYLGDSDGSDPFIAGLIEGNRIENTIGYNTQIKHQAPRPDLDGMPRDRSVTVIRNNIFSKLSGGGEGDRARPNLLVGHWPLEGAGAEDHYLIYGNVFFQNPTERLFQGEGRVALYSNLFVNWLGEGVIFMAHNDVPKVVDVTRNTIISRGRALRISGMPEGKEPRVEGNAMFTEEGLSDWDNGLNFIADLAESEEQLSSPLTGLESLDLTPRSGRLDMPEGVSPEIRWPDEDLDFRGRPRVVGVFGALER
jgi:hypothetical protein